MTHQEFLSKWIKYGMYLRKRAKDLGIDLDSTPMNRLEAAVIFEEVRQEPNQKGAHHVR